MEEQKPSKSTLSKVTKSKKLPVFLGVGFLAIVLVIFGIVFVASKNNNSANKGPVAFTINNQKIYQSDVDQLIKYPVEKGSQSKEAATAAVFESYKVIVVAKDAGISPSDSEIEKSLKAVTPEEVKSDQNYASYEKWFRLQATKEAVNRYIDADPASLSGYKGNSFVFYFGQHIEYGDDYKPAGLNDPALIAQDKTYAKQRADYYYAQIKENKMTPEQVDKEIANDPKLKTFTSTKNPFGQSQDSTWAEDVYYLSVKDYITSTKNTGLSDIRVGQGYPGPTFKQGDSTVDLYYYFVILDEKPQSKGISSKEFDKLLTEAKTTGFTYNYDEGKQEITEQDKAPKTDAELGLGGTQNAQN